MKSKSQGKDLETETLQKKIEENVSMPSKPIITNTRLHTAVLKVLNEDLFFLCDLCVQYEHLQEEITEKEYQIKSMETKVIEKLTHLKCCYY